MCITVQKCCLCLHRRRSNVTSSVEIHVHFLAHVPFFFFVIASWSEGCLTCIRWFCPFTLYQNKSPGPSIHKCCCYGYNLDRSVCLTCYELQQFSDPVVPKSSQHSLHKCFSSCRERKFTSISRQKVTKDIFHGL